MTAKTALSEHELRQRLRVRYTERHGNGEAWAFIPGVRSAAAFDARRTIDAYSMSLWPSRGLTISAFEIKSARGDWLRELRNPAKAEEFCELADFFWLVVGGKDIVKPGELPSTWGLMVPHGAGLRVEVDAPPLRDLAPQGGPRGVRPLPPAFGRSFLAALLRAACAVGNVTPEQIQRAREEAFEDAKGRYEREAAQSRNAFEALREKVWAFEQEAGVRIGDQWGDDPRRVGAAVRMVLSGQSDLEVQLDRLRRLRVEAQSIADFAGRRLGELDEQPVVSGT